MDKKIINYKELFTWVMEFLIFWYLNKLDIQFAPSNADFNCKRNARFVTKNKSGERALSEACLHIISKLFKKTF